MTIHSVPILHYGDHYCVPSIGVVRDGPTVDLPPVERVQLGDVHMLAAIITQKASEPKKMIDTVDWSAVPCVVAAAGASGWRSFANKARAWTVVPRPNGVELFRITLSTGKKDPGRSRLVFEDTKWSHDAVLMLAHEIEKDRLRPFDLDVVTG